MFRTGIAIFVTAASVGGAAFAQTYPVKNVRLINAYAPGGAIRWRTIQLVLDAHYVDGFRLHHPDVPGFTFPTWNPHVRLDYVFLPDAFAGRLRACDVITGDDVRTASDHLPLLVEMSSA